MNYSEERPIDDDYELPIDIEVIDHHAEGQYQIFVEFTDIYGKTQGQLFEIWETKHEGVVKEYSIFSSECGDYQVYAKTYEGIVDPNHIKIFELEYIG